MRRLIFPILLLLALIFIFINLAEVQAVAETLQRGEWYFLLLAICFQLVWMVNLATAYRSIYRMLGIDEKLLRLFMVGASANFVNVITPSAGMGGMAVFVSDARQRGFSPARVAVACAVMVLLDYLAFLSILALGLIVLIRRHNLTFTEMFASALLTIAAIVLAILIFLGMRSADELGHALAWMARQVNRVARVFIHRDYLSEQRAYSFAHEAADGLSRLRQKPVNLILPMLLNINGKVLLIVILTLTFLAFKVPFTLGTVVGGFSIGYLFWIVSPTPAGIGFVEGAMALGLRSLNVPLGEATVLTLAYRGITFWIPLLYGMLALRWLSHHTSVAIIESD